MRDGRPEIVLLAPTVVRGAVERGMWYFKHTRDSKTHMAQSTKSRADKAEDFHAHTPLPLGY